jgi:pimeloyl-ACP methyl ester carboxylesterase
VTIETEPRYVTSKDGTRIAYFVEGSGPPLVLVYGALSDHRFWTKLAPLLDGYTLFNVERRGRSASGDAETYSPEREAEDVVAVIEAVGGQVDVFAHSSGAVVGLAAMEMVPHLIRRAVLYEPPFIFDSDHRTMPPLDFGEQVKVLLANDDRAGAMELFYRLGPGLPEHEIQRQKERGLWKTLEPLAHTMVYDAQVPQVLDLKRLADPAWAVPTLLLYGEISPAWVIEAVHALAQNLGSTSVTMLPKQGHVAMFTAPELLASEIRGFLRPVNEILPMPRGTAPHCKTTAHRDGSS